MPSVWYEVHVVAAGLDVAGVDAALGALRRDRPQRAHRVGPHQHRPRRPGFLRRRRGHDAAAGTSTAVNGCRSPPPKSRSACAASRARPSSRSSAPGTARSSTPRPNGRRRPTWRRRPAASRRGRSRCGGTSAARRRAASSRSTGRPTGPSSSPACAASPCHRRTSCTPTSTDTSATRCRGVLPERRGADGGTPSKGWTGEADWDGVVAPERLPALIDPPGGQIVTANGEIDRRWPGVMTRDWTAPFRTMRIAERLRGQDRLDQAALTAVQLDVHATAGRSGDSRRRGRVEVAGVRQVRAATRASPSSGCAPGIGRSTRGRWPRCTRRSCGRCGGGPSPTSSTARCSRSCSSTGPPSGTSASTRFSTTRRRAGGTTSSRSIGARRATTSCCWLPPTR